MICRSTCLNRFSFTLSRNALRPFGVCGIVWREKHKKSGNRQGIKKSRILKAQRTIVLFLVLQPIGWIARTAELNLELPNGGCVGAKFKKRGQLTLLCYRYGRLSVLLRTQHAGSLDKCTDHQCKAEA